MFFSFDLKLLGSIFTSFRMRLKPPDGFLEPGNSFGAASFATRPPGEVVCDRAGRKFPLDICRKRSSLTATGK